MESLKFSINMVLCIFGFIKVIKIYNCTAYLNAREKNISGFFSFRTSPEHYFCELAMTLGIDVAGKLGCTLDLNIPLLQEVRGKY